MSFKEAVASGWANKMEFTGRSRRSAFWFWYLFQGLVITAFVLVAMGVFAGATALRSSNETLGTIVMVIGIILAIAMGIVGIILVIGTIAVAVRRLHDRGQSGWFLLLYLVPFGNIVVLVFLLLPGMPTDNQYGPVTS
ncbi:MAG: DUF805 domain-containing protein [Candidatus Nanopelagicales bacterium]|jgi:uncharacterized membrane protein YhaH (DUF805 family)